jgi:hypothetical protein
MSTSKGFQGWGRHDCLKCGVTVDGASTVHDGDGPDGQPCDGEVVYKPGDEKLLAYLWKHRHMTPFEMAGCHVRGEGAALRVPRVAPPPHAELQRDERALRAAPRRELRADHGAHQDAAWHSRRQPAGAGRGRVQRDDGGGVAGPPPGCRPTTTRRASTRWASTRACRRSWRACACPWRATAACACRPTCATGCLLQAALHALRTWGSVGDQAVRRRRLRPGSQRNTKCYEIRLGRCLLLHFLYHYHRRFFVRR